MTTVSGQPRSRQIIASEIPVLPEVGSRIIDSGVSRPARLERVDQIERDSVLDGARRVEALELDVQMNARVRAEARDLDERRVADRVDQRRVAAQRPPAMAGRMIRASRSLTGVSSSCM